MALEKSFVEIQEYIHVQGLQWAKEFIAGRRAWMASKGIKATGGLIQSLEAEVLKTLEQAALNRIEMAFDEHGRYVDMRALKASKGGGDYVDAVQDWIKVKGFEAKWDVGFAKKRGLRRVPADVTRRMAWGIVINRHQKYRRRVAWYTKPRAAAVSDLYNRVAVGLPDIVSKQITKAFKSK